MYCRRGCNLLGALHYSMLTVKIVEARFLEPACLKGRPPMRAHRISNLSAFVAIHHGAQSKMTHVADDVENPRWDSVIELWDREMCETIEFIVVIRVGAFLWKHSIHTINMEQFRTQPELRIDNWLALGSISVPLLKSPAKSFGDLHIVATYTEDCYQPTLLQSMFCNLMYCPLPSDRKEKRPPRAVPRPLQPNETSLSLPQVF